MYIVWIINGCTHPVWISAVKHKSLSHLKLDIRLIQLPIPLTKFLHQQMTAFGKRDGAAESLIQILVQSR